MTSASNDAAICSPKRSRSDGRGDDEDLAAARISERDVVEQIAADVDGIAAHSPGGSVRKGCIAGAV